MNAPAKIRSRVWLLIALAIGVAAMAGYHIGRDRAMREHYRINKQNNWDYQRGMYDGAASERERQRDEQQRRSEQRRDSGE